MNEENKRESKRVREIEIEREKKQRKQTNIRPSILGNIFSSTPIYHHTTRIPYHRVANLVKPGITVMNEVTHALAEE